MKILKEEEYSKLSGEELRAYVVHVILSLTDEELQAVAERWEEETGENLMKSTEKASAPTRQDQSTR